MDENPASTAESRRTVLNCSSHCESSKSRDWLFAFGSARASSVLARENSKTKEFINLSGRYFPHWSRPARGVSVTDL